MNVAIFPVVARCGNWWHRARWLHAPPLHPFYCLSSKYKYSFPGLLLWLVGCLQSTESFSVSWDNMIQECSSGEESSMNYHSRYDVQMGCLWQTTLKICLSFIVVRYGNLPHVCASHWSLALLGEGTTRVGAVLFGFVFFLFVSLFLMSFLYFEESASNLFST